MPSFILTKLLFSIVPWLTLIPVELEFAPPIFIVPLLMYAVLLLSTVSFIEPWLNPLPALEVTEIPLLIVTFSFPIIILLNTSNLLSKSTLWAILNSPLV